MSNFTQDLQALFQPSPSPWTPYLFHQLASFAIKGSTHSCENLCWKRTRRQSCCVQQAHLETCPVSFWLFDCGPVCLPCQNPWHQSQSKSKKNYGATPLNETSFVSSKAVCHVRQAGYHCLGTQDRTLVNFGGFSRLTCFGFMTPTFLSSVILVLVQTTLFQFRLKWWTSVPCLFWTTDRRNSTYTTSMANVCNRPWLCEHRSVEMMETDKQQKAQSSM